MDKYNTKSILSSKTFWGIAVSIMSKLAVFIFSVQIDPNTQQAIVDLGMMSAGFLTSFAGDVMGIYGRIKAKQVIG